MEHTGETTVLRVDEHGARRDADELVREVRVTVRLHERNLLDATCSPGALRELAYGHLLSEGWIYEAGDVASLSVDEDRFVASAVLRGGDGERREARAVTSSLVVSSEDVLGAVSATLARGVVFRATGGTHVAGVCCVGGACLIAEDISRTCALEKALGKALLAGVDAGRSVLALSSRVPRRFVRKAARAGIPVLAAVSAPTFEAVAEAERLGVCLCGFVRGDRMNVYSRPERIGFA